MKVCGDAEEMLGFIDEGNNVMRLEDEVSL